MPVMDAPLAATTPARDTKGTEREIDLQCIAQYKNPKQCGAAIDVGVVDRAVFTVHE